MDAVEDLQRLAAMMGIIAVRLVQLRDLADGDCPTVDNPEALQQAAPPVWIEVISRLCGISPEALTPRGFLLTIARRGGYLGRKHDARPGWKVIWQGWYDIQRMVEGVELVRPP